MAAGIAQECIDESDDPATAKGLGQLGGCINSC